MQSDAQIDVLDALRDAARKARALASAARRAGRAGDADTLDDRRGELDGLIEALDTTAEWSGDPEGRVTKARDAMKRLEHAWQEASAGSPSAGVLASAVEAVEAAIEVAASLAPREEGLGRSK